MTEKRKVPNLRFPGFTDDWEQRKLGDICKITMGQSPLGSTYSDKPTTYILVQGNADLKNGWVVPRVWTTQKTKTADINDLIMSVRAPAGAMGKTSYNIVLGRGVAGIKGSEYIYQNLLKMYEDGYWKKLSTGSTFDSINASTLSSAEILIPKNYKEQHKIGTLFQNLDSTITLHQRKLDSLKKLKASLVHKIFTQEVRFKKTDGTNFEDWVQEPILNIAETFIGLVTTMTSHYVKDGVRLIRNSDIQEGRFVFKESIFLDYEFAEKNKTRKHKLRDIVTVHTGDVGTSAIIDKNLVGSIGFATIVTRVKNSEKILPEYVCTYFNSNDNKKQIERAITGDGRNNLNMKDFNKLIIPTPKSIEEQHKIAEFFTNMEDAIMDSEAKLEKYKELKKGLLQQMFV